MCVPVYIHVDVLSTRKIETERENDRQEGNTAYKRHLFMSNLSCPAVPGISGMLERGDKKCGWKDVANERERSS